MNDDHYPTLDEEDPTESGLVLDGPIAHEGETEISGVPKPAEQPRRHVVDRHREIARRLIAELSS